MMSSRDRVLRQIRGEAVDRPPLMGGWFHGVQNLARLCSLSVDEYLAAPAVNLVRANRALKVDCLVSAPIIPDHRDQVREGHWLDSDRPHYQPESLKEDAEGVQDNESDIVASLGLAEVERDYRESLTRWKSLAGDIVLIPTFWESVPNFMLYGHYGYESYLMAIALYPESVGRLYWKSAVEARERNHLIARLIGELDLPPVVFTGHDICNNVGPLCSMDFLREYYFPQERFALEPLVDAGVRVVRHCDGNVMAMIEDCLGVGYSGFQGFQYECGVDPFSIAAHCTVTGEPLLFFAGLNVTRTLPFGIIDDVREEIEYVMSYTAEGRGLFFFTSSSIGPEVPLENVQYAYDYVAHREYGRGRSAVRFLDWPWKTRHGASEV